MKRFLPIARIALLAALFGVGGFLAQKPTRGITTPSLQPDVATIETGDQNAAQATALQQPFLAQLLQTLELGGTNEALLGIHNVPGPEVPGTADSPQNQPNTSPQAQAIADYLTKSSEIGGTISQRNIGAALSLASRGEPGVLFSVGKAYRTMGSALSTLTPPQELTAQHDSTLKLLDRFAGFLEALAKQPKDQIQDAWASPEREEIIKESKRLQEEIRTVVTTYQVVLPLGVLP